MEWSGQITEFPGGSGGTDVIMNYLLKSLQCALKEYYKSVYYIL